jgi:deazaflavin-dependent oxidoreductase (nitroreductase family)
VTEDEPDVCYLTTSGRITGRPHRIEIWFARHQGTVYLLSGGRERSDWVRNIMVTPQVVLEIADRKRPSRAHVVTDSEEDALARRVVVEKYRARGQGELTEWGRTALPVAIEWG